MPDNFTRRKVYCPFCTYPAGFSIKEGSTKKYIFNRFHCSRCDIFVTVEMRLNAFKMWPEPAIEGGKTDARQEY